MKKIISCVIAFMLVSLTAFASDAEELAALIDKHNNVLSASVEFTLKAEQNKPLDIISQIPQDEDAYINYNPQMIAESLLGTEIKVNASYSMSNDYKKMLAEFYTELDAPIQINDDLKLAAWTRIGIWLEYDVTDPGNPVYRTIIKNPITKKYYVMDMSEYFKENPDKLREFNADTIKERQEALKAALLDNAEVTKKNGAYTLKFTDASAKKYITDILSESMESMFREQLEDVAPDSFIDDINEFFNKVNIFGKDGITITVSVNDKGYIAAETSDTHIAFNVYDAISEFDGNTKGLDRSKADIDLTIKASCKYKDHNSAKPTLPVLTEDNSYVTDYNERIDYDSNRYDENGIELWTDHDGEEPVLVKDNVVYFPYEDMARQIGLDVKTAANGGTFTISCGEHYSVDVKNEITFEDEAFDMDIPMIISENGRWYCTEDFLWDIGISAFDISYDMDTNSLKYRFYYHGLPETYSDDDTDDHEGYNPYIGKSYYYVDSDRALYLANGTAYMPIYDLLSDISSGDFSFDRNGFEYTAKWENSLGINTVSVYPGDRFVTVNGNQIDLPYEVVDIDGVMRVPVSFAEGIGLEIEEISVSPYGGYTNFGFRRAGADDPDYDSDYSGYYTSRYDNWFYNLFN